MKATRPSPCHSKVGSCLYRPVHLHGFGLPSADLHLAFCRPQKLTASCKSCSAEPRWAMSKLSWRPSPGSQGRAGELPALLPGECDILNAKGDNDRVDYMCDQLMMITAQCEKALQSLTHVRVLLRSLSPCLPNHFVLRSLDAGANPRRSLDVRGIREIMTGSPPPPSTTFHRW